jgi:Ca2+-binding RTX toxin-like protein
VTYLYAVGADDDGVSVFSVSAAGVLTPVQNVSGLSEPRGLHIATVAGTPFLFIANVGADIVLSNVINPGIGTITFADAVVDNATLQLDGAVSVTSALVGAKTFAFVAGSSESVTFGGISVFDVAADGSLINVFNQPDNASLFLGTVDAITTANIAGTTYLFAVNIAELAVTGGALSVFGVAADGTLISFAAVSDGGIGGADPLKLARACTVTTAVVGGNTFVIVGSQSDSGISVFRVDTTGLTINGTTGNDTIDALNSAAGQFLPSELDDLIFGFAGNDTLEGLGGGDTLIGGKGKDSLTGDLGADIFDFNKSKESVKGAGRDVITDFDAVDDVIDLGGIDAKGGVPGNQKFKFIAGHKFHKIKGELHFLTKTGFVVVEGDVNGDGRADFQIEVHNLTNDLATLAKGDFIL